MPRPCATRATPPALSPRPQRALALSPDLPEALFESGAASAEAGDKAAAAQAWLRLIEVAPQSDLAPLARANLQRLE